MGRWVFILVMAMFCGRVQASPSILLTVKISDKVQIETPGHGEIKKKAIIAGEMLDMLSRELRNEVPIYICFSRKDDFLFASDYAVCYHDAGQGYPAHIQITCLTQRCRPDKVLRLAEYAVRNLDKVRKMQRRVPISGWCPCEPQGYVLTIPDSMVRSVLSAPMSEIVSRIDGKKVYRKEDRKDEIISYFYSDGKYHVFIRKEIEPENWGSPPRMREAVAISLDDISQFERIGSDALVFDTSASFYFIEDDRYLYVKDETVACCKLSRRHVIHRARRLSSIPYKVAAMGGGRIAISFYCGRDQFRYLPAGEWDGGVMERCMLYLSGSDILMDNLDEMLEAKYASETMKDDIIQYFVIKF